MPLSPAAGRRKVGHLLRHFGSQRDKACFRATFEAVMHLRGVACRAASGLAAAFHLRKRVL